MLGVIEDRLKKADVVEQRDVAATHPDVVKRFEEYFKTARVDSELWPVRAAGRGAQGRVGNP